jgi:hypothetical protein
MSFRLFRPLSLLKPAWPSERSRFREIEPARHDIKGQECVRIPPIGKRLAL